MKRLVYPLLHFLLTGWSSIAGASDWMGLEDEQLAATLRYQASLDADDNYNHAFAINYPIDAAKSLDAEYQYAGTQDSLGTFNYHSVVAGLTSSINDSMQLGFSYQFDGEVSELEIESFGITLTGFMDNFSASIEYRSGEARLYSRNDLNRPRIPESWVSDMNSFQFNLLLLVDEMTVSLRHEQNDYERNISALTQYPFLRAIVSPAVLVNGGLLLKSSSSLGLSFFQEQRQLGISISQSETEIGNLRSSSLQLDWSEYLNEVTLLMSLALQDDDDNSWAATAGLEWQL